MTDLELRLREIKLLRILEKVVRAQAGLFRGNTKVVKALRELERMRK